MSAYLSTLLAMALVLKKSDTHTRCRETEPKGPSCLLETTLHRIIALLLPWAVTCLASQVHEALHHAHSYDALRKDPTGRVGSCKQPLGFGTVGSCAAGIAYVTPISVKT